MDVNRNKPDRWKQDIARSVDMFNDWFLRFAPAAYRETRVRTTSDVEATLNATQYLTDISVAVLKSNPAILPTLRMSACPPLAVDRLVGLSGVSRTLVNSMERKHRLPPRMPSQQLDDQLCKIGETIKKLADPHVFVWLGREEKRPSKLERYRAATYSFRLIVPVDQEGFDSGYLGYEAAEGIDWVWEHRIDDLAGFGL